MGTAKLLNVALKPGLVCGKDNGSALKITALERSCYDDVIINLDVFTSTIDVCKIQCTVYSLSILRNFLNHETKGTTWNDLMRQPSEVNSENKTRSSCA